MNVRKRLTAIAFVPLVLGNALTDTAHAGGEQDLLRLLETRTCPSCNLEDSDLVRADLREARLKGAHLQRANLSGARLEGADLRGANLSFTSLSGANLQGADLRGAILDGTDMRSANLSGTQLDQNALATAHWDQAKGVSLTVHSYAELHNAGVTAFQLGRQPDAERFFSEAIRKQPEAGISWVGRGITRLEQGKTDLASQDFIYAASLYQVAGDDTKATQLKNLARSIDENPKDSKGGNGVGSQLLQGALSAFQAIAPLAIKAFSGL